MNPDELELIEPSKIDPDIELALLSTPVHDWEPVVVHDKVVIQGEQNVLVARKHGITHIPAKAEV